MQLDGWDRALKVTADGKGLVGHAGAVLLRKAAYTSRYGPHSAAGYVVAHGIPPSLMRTCVPVSRRPSIRGPPGLLEHHGR